MLCVSRLAQGYVLEDGSGRMLGEAPSLDRFAEQAARAAMRGGRSFVARITLLVCAIRLTIEEKLEPMFEEFAGAAGAVRAADRGVRVRRPRQESVTAN